MGRLLSVVRSLPPRCQRRVTHWACEGDEDNQRHHGVAKLTSDLVVPQVPPILLPVQLTLVPEKVLTFNDVTNALRHCVQVDVSGDSRRLRKKSHVRPVTLAALHDNGKPDAPDEEHVLSPDITYPTLGDSCDPDPAASEPS
jgi:hypothetical protein